MNIAFLFLEKMLATSALNAYELWMAASLASSAGHGVPLSQERRTPQLKTVGIDHQPITNQAGLTLTPHSTIAATEQFELIYIPAVWRNPRPLIRRHPELINWLKHQYDNGASINATGTGVCFLAETGLLDGLVATTHWHYFDRFAADYPQVNLKRQHFITEAGRLYCAGSINALTDLVIHHIRRHFGLEVAERISAQFSPEARKPFNHMRYKQSESDLHSDELVLQSQLWIQDHIEDPTLCVAALADIFNISSRTLSRRFKNAIGESPKTFILSTRHGVACDLLNQTNLTINEVAERVGYLDPSLFAKNFHRFARQSPREYRVSRRAKLFALRPS